MIFLWAFTDAKAAVDQYRYYRELYDHAEGKYKRARSRKWKSYWLHERRACESWVQKFQSRYPFINLDGPDAVLEATLYELENFYKRHKHCIIGQYK
jgi:hypothetical protein